MSTPTRGASTALVVGIVVVFVVTVVSAAGIAIAIEDGARAASMISLIVAPLASVLGILAVLGKVEELGSKVTEVKSDTADLTNGLLDAKIRAAVADVIGPELVHDQAKEQIVLDRARREARNATNTTPAVAIAPAVVTPAAAVGDPV